MATGPWAPRPNRSVGAETVALLDRIWAKVQVFAKEYADTDLPTVQMVTGTGRFGMPRGSIRKGSYITQRNGDGLWTHKESGRDVAEFFIAGETLGRGAVEALQTILHEATHALCAANRDKATGDLLEAQAAMMIAESAGDTETLEKYRAVVVDAEARLKRWKETTRQERYHNGNFRDHAKTFGLEYVHPRANDEVGYSAVTLSEFGQVMWADELNELERMIPAYIELEFVPVTADDPSDDRVRVAPGGGGVDTPPEPKEHRRTYRCSCNRSIAAYPSDMAEATITCGRCGDDFH